MDGSLGLARVMGGEEVCAAVSLPEAAHAMERAFVAWADGAVTDPQSLATRVDAGTYHVKACASRSLFVAKTNANYPGNPARGKPTIQGVVAVFDAADGRLLMLLDSPAVTNLRTAATTATAVKHLAADGARCAAIIGCGALGRFHALALRQCLGFDHLRFFDTDAARAQGLASWAAASLGVDAMPCAALHEATSEADVVVTCTWSAEPFLGEAELRGGVLVAAVGADNDQKAELKPELLARARVVQSGVRGELADAIRGKTRRASAGEIVVFKSSGIAIEDLALCALLLEKAGIHCG